MADLVITCGKCKSQSWIIYSGENKMKCGGCGCIHTFYFNRKDKCIRFDGTVDVHNIKLAIII